jgi:nucleotide-binding universal stress UspA family protein
MRVLLAIDGSAPADIAIQLVGWLDWPDASTIRVLTVVDAVNPVFGGPWPPVSSGGSALARLDAEMEAHGREVLQSAMRALHGSGARVESKLARGRPASCIVDEARRFDADLIVVGSRGHGAISSMVLGSVAGEVVDHAQSPVLVTRTTQVKRIVLAHDGSENARAAEAMLASWPIFRDAEIEVVSVAQTSEAWHWIALPEPPMLMDTYVETMGEIIRDHRQIAAGVAGRLKASGLKATTTVPEGDPASRVLESAESHHADLIVTGTHGWTGLRRLVLGSVARNIIQHAPMSVLVTRLWPVPSDNGA